MPLPDDENSDQMIARLLHDLRQPIGNIGLGLFYLNLLLGEPGGKLQEQIRALEKQAERASRLIDQAAAELYRRPAQPAPSLELTKAATSAVT
jgi:signal transduction histidine kinase